MKNKINVTLARLTHCEVWVPLQIQIWGFFHLSFWMGLSWFYIVSAHWFLILSLSPNQNVCSSRNKLLLADFLLWQYHSLFFSLKSQLAMIMKNDSCAHFCNQMLFQHCGPWCLYVQRLTVIHTILYLLLMFKYQSVKRRGSSLKNIRNDLQHIMIPFWNLHI